MKCYAIEERGFTYYGEYTTRYIGATKILYSIASKNRTEPCHVINHIRNLSSISVHVVLCDPHTIKTCTKREAFLLYTTSALTNIENECMCHSSSGTKM